MKKNAIRLIALLLIVPVLFSGCSVVGLLARLFLGGYSNFDDMEYTRPDVTALETSVAECVESAATETDLDALVWEITDFTERYTDFYTQYMLAYLHYCMDMTDTYWEEEYNYCAEYTTTVDAARDDVMYALADSPLREELEGDDYFGEGYFDDYDGESIWTDAFTVLMQQESQLLTSYYELSAQSNEVAFGSEEYYTLYGTQLETVFAELVALRQRIALEAGYGSYPEFAYAYYYDRDYTVEDAEAYVEDIQSQLVPIYIELAQSGYWSGAISESTEAETYNYVRRMARSMGGTVEEAFEHMAEYDLYDISFGVNKYNASFETFLYGYSQPFIFMNPSLTVQDHLTFAHEFGHFCNDYASAGSMAGIDAAEVFSQGMEYLSLCYGESSQELETMKMTDSLSVYVEQAAYSSFEHQIYALPREQITPENIREIFRQTGEAFGFDSWGFDQRCYVMISHFFTQPLYVISYVVSNDAAMQLYQMEQNDSGSGLRVYMDSLDTEQEGFLAFLEEANLESPFAEGRIEAVTKTFETELG